MDPAPWEAGREAYPGVDLPRETFERAMRSHGAAPGSAADLYLATACAEGVPCAFEALNRTAMPRVRAFLLGRRAGADEVDAVVRDLPGHLVERAGADGPSRIATYAGRSSIVTWLSVVAWRLLLKRRRRNGVAPLPALEPADRRAVQPLEALVGRESAGALATAVRAAWTELTAREGLALMLRYGDGWSQREIARIMGVGEPRVSRLLEAGARRMRDVIRRALRETPRAGGVTWEGLREAVASRLASSGDPPL